jgi:hypothetical protein
MVAIVTAVGSWGVNDRVSVAVGVQMPGWIVDGVVLVPAAVGFGQANGVGLRGLIVRGGRGCGGAQQSAGIVRRRWNAAASASDQGQSRSSLR